MIVGIYMIRRIITMGVEEVVIVKEESSVAAGVVVGIEINEGVENIVEVVEGMLLHALLILGGPDGQGMTTGILVPVVAGADFQLSCGF